MEQKLEGDISSRQAPGAYARVKQVEPAAIESTSTVLGRANLARPAELESQSDLDRASGRILTGLAYGWSAINSVAVSACMLSAGIIGLNRLADKLDRSSSFLENCFRQAGSIALAVGFVGGFCALAAKRFFRSEEKAKEIKPDENAVRSQLTDFATHAGVGITAAVGTLAAMRAIELVNPASGLFDKLSRIPLEGAGISFTISLALLIASTGLSDSISAIFAKIDKLFDKYSAQPKPNKN